MNRIVFHLTYDGTIRDDDRSFRFHFVNTEGVTFIRSGSERPLRYVTSDRYGSLNKEVVHLKSNHSAIRIVELEDRIAPDNSFEGAYAIYFRLSEEPSMTWQETFETTMKSEIHPKIVSFVGPLLRVVIRRQEHLDTLMRQITDLVARTNEATDSR